MLAAALLLAVALPGLILVRSGSALARLLGLLAMLAFALAALDPAATRALLVPPRIAAVTTASGDLAAAAQRQLQRAVAAVPGAGLRVATPAAGELQAQWLAALLHGGAGAGERLLVWTGDSAPLPGADTATVLTAAPPLPFEPDALVLQPKAPLQAGRPAALELSCRELPAPATAQVRVTDAAGTVLVTAEVQLQRDHTAVVEFVPPHPGRAEVAVELPVGDAVLRRRGELEIGAASPVLVVEDGAVVSAALQAQGVAVVSSPRVPADLAGYAAVVLLLPQFPVVQQRLVRALDDGLGLLVGGPALPQPGEPLAASMPVQRLGESPVAAADGEGSGAGRGNGKDAATPPAAPTVPQLPPPDRDAGRQTDEPPAKPETAPPKGDLSGAQGQPGKLVETERRNIAVVLVVDRSGSMGLPVRGGRNRMSYAKTSALRTAEALLEGDEVGIVSFGSQGQARVELPMTAATDTQRIAAGVDKLRHAENEQTWLLSGLRRAFELLQPGQFAVKHVVVITDGAFYAEEYTQLRGEAHRLKTQGVTVSIVQVGGQGIDALPGYDPADIARDGGGRYLPVSDATKVPVFVSLEVTQSLASVGRKPRGECGDQPGDAPRPPEQKPPQPQPPEPEPPAPEPEARPPGPAADARLAVRAVAESPLLQPRPQPSWPSLADAIACTATVDAHVLLAVGREGTPLLAFANRGLGRIAAFAADLAGPACERFRRDRDFPARLSQWVAALAPPATTPATADLLRSWQVQPPRPTPRALQRLAAGSRTPVLPVADYAPPPPHTRLSAHGLAPEWARYALLALLLLAVGEWASARRVPR